MGPSRARGALLAVLAVALLLPVVALASRPEGAAASGALPGADSARLLLDVTTYLFAVFVLASLLVIVWAFWPRPDEELPPLPPRRSSAMSTVLVTLAFVGLALWLRSRGRLGAPPSLNPAGSVAGRLPGGLVGQGRAGVPPGFDWLAAAIVVGLLAAAALLAWWFLRPRRRGGPTPLGRLQAVLDEAIDDVLGESDPRRAVIAAWARLERVLARAGLPRGDSEAPFEYAARAGADLRARLGVEGAWLERLAGLFEWARFSTHDVTPVMREEALGGLVAVRDELTHAPR